MPKAENFLLYRAQNLSTFGIHTMARLQAQIHLTTPLSAEIEPWKSPYLTTSINMLHGHEGPGHGFSLPRDTLIHPAGAPRCGIQPFVAPLLTASPYKAAK